MSLEPVVTSGSRVGTELLGGAAATETSLSWREETLPLTDYGFDSHPGTTNNPHGSPLMMRGEYLPADRPGIVCCGYVGPIAARFYSFSSKNPTTGEGPTRPVQVFGRSAVYSSATADRTGPGRGVPVMNQSYTPHSRLA